MKTHYTRARRLYMGVFKKAGIAWDWKRPARIRSLEDTCRAVFVFKSINICACCHARTTSMSAQQVVYPGVLRSCFIDHTRLPPAKPALAMCTVPLP